ncbi:MAG: pyridoxal 5'-phosphate synthase glutaminase subunit PdxT [Deltaproteobacteria bacterium]
MIGVLDLQGGVAEHLEHLRFLGVECCAVKKAEHLSDIAGLIIPGGESTCLSRLLRIFEMDTAIVNEHKRGMKIWGTCAGAILLAKTVVGELPILSLIDITIERNGFGSQLDSFTASAVVAGVSNEKIPLVFIRAPKITSVGSGVNVLLKIDNYIAVAENDDVLATIFHPELTGDNSFHRYFAHKCGVNFNESAPTRNTNWKSTSWMRPV